MEEHVFNIVDGNVQKVRLGDRYAGDFIDLVVEKVVNGTLKTTRDSWSIRAQTGQHIRNVPKKMRYTIYNLTILTSVIKCNFDNRTTNFARLNLLSNHFAEFEFI